MATIRANAEAQPLEVGASPLAKWAIALFFVTIFIPGSFYIGVRMTPYRLYLFLMAVPMLLRILKDRTLRITPVDFIVLLAIAWRSVSILANHGTAEAIFAAALFGELALGYLLGRVFIRTAADFRFFFKCFLGMLAAMLPFALSEFLTHQRFLPRLAGIFLTQAPDPTTAAIRFGLRRAQASFETFLVYGAFCAIGFANVWYVFARRFPLNLVFAGFVAFMAALAISTSALITVFFQIGLMIYGAVFNIRGKWIAMALAALVVPVAFELAVGMSVVDYITTEIMFSPISGQARALHFDYGLREVMRNPLYGVGLGEWGTPYWLSQTTDSHWLSLALRNGLPALALSIAAYVAHFLSIAFAGGLDEDERLLRTGYLISFAAAMLTFFYSSFYAGSLVFFMMYFAAGAWFYDGRRLRVGGGRPAVERRAGARAGRAGAAAARREAQASPQRGRPQPGRSRPLGAPSGP